MTTPNLDTRYLGLTLRSPLIASPSPLTGDVDTARRLAAAGVGALVLPSLFEEEIVAEEVGFARALEMGADVQGEASSYFPTMNLATVADQYLANLERIKKAVNVPVIASINATTAGAWSRYAAMMAGAGADALELNVYRLAANPALTAQDVEAATLEVVAEACRVATVPVAVKLSPYFSAMAAFARQVTQAGAAGLVLFNRFYQPDIDLESMDVLCRLELSTSVELGLPLRWIAILRPQLPASVSLAATSGVHSGRDAAKALAVGASAVMMTSELLRSGPERLIAVEEELRTWLVEHEYESADQLRGSMSQTAAGDGEVFERVNYMRTLRSWADARP
ncbi:MAG: dihydroorotate dehydrogenase-like protein [Candidatus Dormibacteria bacterium]|jgi:dihydroorotate dehydrogenase (fumarate)